MRGGSGFGSGARASGGAEAFGTSAEGRGHLGIGLFGVAGTKFGKVRVSGIGSGFFKAKSAGDTREVGAGAGVGVGGGVARFEW